MQDWDASWCAEACGAHLCGTQVPWGCEQHWDACGGTGKAGTCYVGNLARFVCQPVCTCRTVLTVSMMLCWCDDMCYGWQCDMLNRVGIPWM